MCKILKIKGDSLFPEFRDGDFVVIAKSPLFIKKLIQGDIIAFQHKKYGVLIKKILDVSEQGINVIGNLEESIDSRVFGRIQPDTIIGKVVLHIPRSRVN
jgi:phage repressor protein C with HTH and peptisase S24 domain